MGRELRHDRLAAAAGVTGAAALLVLFVFRFRPPLLLASETIRPAIGALLLVLAAAGCGRLAGFRGWADALAAGFALFGTLCAIAGLADTRLILPITIAAACWGAFVAGRERWPADLRPPLLLAVPAAIAIGCAVVPVNSPDELVYKLAIPHAWLMHGSITQLPLASNSYLVMALQSADLAALVLGGGVAAKLAHVALWCAAIAIIRRVAGMSAAVVMAWTPALMIIAGWAWSEWGVLALLVLSYERWRRDDVDGAAIALGLAAASKYTALPWLLAYGVLLLLRRRGAVLRTAALVLLFGGFFYVRNAVWTGSPLAPLFLPDAPAVENYRGSGWSGLLRGLDVFDPRISDESLGVLLPLAAIAGLFAWRRERDLVLLGVLQMPVLLTIAPGSRNIIDGVAPLALAGVAAFADPFLRARTAKIVCAAALAAQLVLTLFTLESYEMLPYLSGRETAEAYLSRTRNFTRPFDWIARETPRDARILLLGENRTYYLQREFVAATNLDGPRIAAWLSRFTDPDAFRAELRRQGISYVVIHMPWYRVGKTPLAVIEKEYVLQVPPPAHAMLMRYLATDASRVYRDGEYLIYRCL